MKTISYKSYLNEKKEANLLEFYKFGKNGENYVSNLLNDCQTDYYFSNKYGDFVDEIIDLINVENDYIINNYVTKIENNCIEIVFYDKCFNIIFELERV